MSMKQTTTATPQERTAQSNGAAYAIAPEIAIDPNQFSTKDLNNFADGVRHLTDNYKPEDLHSLHDSMHEIAPEDLTTGEALITYGIMHNPVMEAIASNHAMDAMAFANDVMINGAQIERLQSRTQMAFASLDADDEDLTPEQRARKRERERAQDTAEALEDIHDEQLKEWQEHWDKQMHTIGGQQYSGKELMKLKDFLAEEDNAQAFDQHLMKKYGVSKEEAKKRREDLQRTLELMEKERNKKLSEEEKAELESNKNNPTIAADLADLKKIEEDGRGIVYSSEHTEIEAATASETENSTSIRSSLLANTNDISVPKDKVTTVTPQPSILSATPSGIETGVTLTTTYNDEASSITIEAPANTPPEQQQKVAAAPAGNFGFG
ncbi:MAG: hypothetical protein IAE63_04795 [Alphaproteobacteria bacterium]|nr:hypothetical protein [Alphaproteobacteria bacterium]